jgi:hypothetical protein
LLQFVDSVASSPTVRLDLNDGSTWNMLEGTEFPPPPLRRAVAQTLLTDGGVIPSSAYDLRVLTLVLGLNASTADAAAEALQALFRELDRPANLIRWQPHGVTNPVFFRTFRTSVEAVLRHGQPDNRRKTLTVNIPAEYAAYGLLETPVSGVTVSTNPAAAVNGCFVDVDYAVPSNANPYFETDVTNWTPINGPTLTRSTAQAHEGVASMLITPDGASADPRAQSEAIAVVAGRSYFGQGWLRSPGTPTVGITIRWYSDAGGSAFVSESGSLAALTADTWTYSSVTGVAPSGAVSMRLAPKYSGTPAAATTLFVDEAIVGPSLGVKGDVEAPAIIEWPSGGVLLARQTLMAVRRRGDPSAAPFLFQAEALTQGTDTTTQPNDANFSGAGSNYSRCTFATATMQTRLSTTTIGTSGVDLRGRYRVFMRYRKNSPTTDPINLQLRWGDTVSTTTLVHNDVYSTLSTGLIVAADLGEVSIPAGYDPVTDSSGVELPVSNAFKFELRAERTSGTSTIDFDFLVFVPADDRLAILQWQKSSDDYVLDAVNNSAHAVDGSGNVLSIAAPAISGGLPMLSPGQTNRIYMFRAVNDLQSWTLTTVSPVSVSYYPRYLTVRPAST